MVSCGPNVADVDVAIATHANDLALIICIVWTY